MLRCRRGLRCALLIIAAVALFLLPAPLPLPAPRVRAAAKPASAVAAPPPPAARASCEGGVDWFSARRTASGPPPEPPIAMSAAQRGANARVLIVTSDNRPLEASWERRSFWALATMLNRDYARAHGYDFAFVHTFLSATPPGLYANDTQRACFHARYALWRVHNWCKVLIMWAAVNAVDARGAPLYDLVVYVDSDAIIQDVGADISEAWAPGAGARVFGAQFCDDDDDPSATAAAGPLAGTTLAGCGGAAAAPTTPLFIIYSDNVPDDPSNPNLGFYVMRNRARTRSFIADWWDFVDEEVGHKYAYYAFHEQTAMHKLMRRNWGGAVSVTMARYAGDEQARLVRHINSEENRYGGPNSKMRIDRFSRHWLGRGGDAESFEAAVRQTLASCDAAELDVIATAAHLEADASPRHKG
jgi:hypothetical protein